MAPRPQALDYGFRSLRGGRIAEIATALAVALMVTLTVPLALIGQRQSAIGRVNAWAASGPPCPVASRAAFLAYGEPIREAFRFEGVRYGMSSGYASCARIATDRVLGLGHMPICQFNDPAVLEVTTPRGQVFFMTRFRPATVTIAHGRLRCVLAAHLDPNWLRN